LLNVAIHIVIHPSLDSLHMNSETRCIVIKLSILTFIIFRSPSWYMSRYNLTGPKTLPTIWHTYIKLVTKYQISAINSCWEKCDEKCAYMFNVYKNQLSRQTGSRNLMGPKRFPRYGVPKWRLWPNIRSLSSIVAEKNVTKNVHICSMCIKTN
jgi:ribosomal protein L28